jgi:alkaline phosphatase D
MRSPFTLRVSAIPILVCWLLASGAAAADRDDDGYPRLMQGPMVGAVSPNSAMIWLRTSGEYEISIQYATNFEMRSPITTDAITSKKADDYTLVITIDNLEPATEYFYRVLVNGEGDKYLEEFPAFRFATAPAKGAASSFRIAYGSCPKFQDDRVQPIWTVITQFSPDLFFWIGDNIYGDTLDPDILREEYRRQRDIHGLQPLLHNVPHLAIWDDHDFGLNNHDRSNPIKRESLEVFKKYWANPAYGLPDTPGVFFTYSYGGVDFFFLDDRFYRDPDKAEDTSEKTMLGTAQFEWLQKALVASEAIFKVIISGSGWSTSKGEGGDSWAAYLHERDRLFDFIRDQKISGVVLASGDSHIGEINAIPRSEKGGYDLYDLVSSPLAQRTPDSWLHRRPERRIRPVYFVNGVVSWPDKVHDESRQRQEFYDAGKGYYEIEPED